MMNTLNCSVDDNLNISDSNMDSAGTINFLQTLPDTGDIADLGNHATYTDNCTCWHYYQDYYYPIVIRESYPVYLQERAKDKAKQAFEIIKILKDKKLVQLKTVGNFIDLMDELIKIL